VLSQEAKSKILIGIIRRGHKPWSRAGYKNIVGVSYSS